MRDIEAANLHSDFCFMYFMRLTGKIICRNGMTQICAEGHHCSPVPREVREWDGWRRRPQETQENETTMVNHMHVFCVMLAVRDLLRHNWDCGRILLNRPVS